MKKSLTTLVLLAGLVIVLLDTLPALQNYGLSEFVAPIKFLNGQTGLSENLYKHHFLEIISTTPLMFFSQKVVNFLQIEPYRIDFLYAIFCSLAVFMAFFLFLRDSGISPSISLIFTAWLIISNPLINFIYGYQYEVAAGGASIGVMAFSIITLLLYYNFSEKRILHAVFFVLLYVIHPLNALLYLGFVFLLLGLKVLFFNRGQIRKIFLSNWPILISGAILFAFSLIRYRSPFTESPEKLFYLISLINGFGHEGGFFFSWLNPDKLIHLWTVTPSFLFLLWEGYKKGYLGKKLAVFCFSYALYTIALCLANYLAYQFKASSLLALCLSRVFALQIPLLYVCLCIMIVKRYAQDSRNLALVSVLLMACLPFITFLLPFLVVLLVWGKEKKLVLYALALIVLLIPIIALDYKDGAIILTPLSIHDQRVRLMLFALTFCFVLAYRLAGDRPAWSRMALLIAVSLVGYYYFMDYRAKLAGGGYDEFTYGGL